MKPPPNSPPPTTGPPIHRQPATNPAPDACPPPPHNEPTNHDHTTTKLTPHHHRTPQYDASSRGSHNVPTLRQGKLHLDSAPIRRASTCQPLMDRRPTKTPGHHISTTNSIPIPYKSTHLPPNQTSPRPVRHHPTAAAPPIQWVRRHHYTTTHKPIAPNPSGYTSTANPLLIHRGATANPIPDRLMAKPSPIRTNPTHH